MPSSRKRPFKTSPILWSAVEQAGELEQRLNKTAELLDEVNETLEQAAKNSDDSGGSSDRSPPVQRCASH